MRAIAQELGSTTGVVTHYFRNKDELMLFALERVFDNLLEDMDMAAAGKQGIERLEDMVFAALPCSPRGINGWQVWVAFLGYAIGRRHLVEEHQKRYASLRQLLYQELEGLQSAKLLKEGIDLSLEANTLIVLVDGIGVSCVINAEQFQPQQQCHLIRRHIRLTLLSVPDVSLE